MLDAANQGLGYAGGKAFMEGDAAGADKANAEMRAAKPAPKGYLQAQSMAPVSVHGLTEGADLLPNAFTPDEKIYPEDTLAEKLRFGEPLTPFPTQPADMAVAFGMTPFIADNKNYADEQAAAAKADMKLVMPKKGGKQYLQVNPEDVVREADIGKRPDGRYEPTPVQPGLEALRSGNIDPYSKPLEAPATAAEKKVQADVHKVIAKHGLASFLGAVLPGKSIGQAAESIGQVLDNERRNALGDFDPAVTRWRSI
jgi:hypothetical protein